MLEARAVFEGEEHPTYIRIAEIEGTIYLDLTNERWEVVRINAHGWAVIPMDQGQARFKRARGMLPIPTPIPSDTSIISVFSATGTPQKSVGKQKSLAEVMGIPANSSAWRLTVGFILCAFRGSIPYPVLVINGEQGSGKSTIAKLLRSLLDPSTAPLRSLPRDKRDLFISAVNSWVLCFDNVSDLPEWLSDALCRVSTGGGDSARELYTDDEEVLLTVMRPCILNGITDFVERPDLADRSLLVTIEPIPEEARRPESEILSEAAALWPIALGAFLTVVCKGLANLPSTRLPRLPRMADFAL